jgi:2-dehydropantoate 2-reductase
MSIQNTGTLKDEPLSSRARAALEASQLHVTEQALTAPGSPATSSLTRDLIAGRRTEVEAVLADLAARARAARTATPLIDLAVLTLRIHNRQIGP